jgi:ethanolamine utilization protein EutA
MIVSRLRLARMSSTFALPRYDIVERQIRYESPVIMTPLVSDQIDSEPLSKWLNQQYQLAGIQPSEVNTGAVIFTGESASKSNAQAILHGLAEDSGAFVVATAGSDLEAVLAAKGSGAVAYSREQKDILVNVDIGGGTANAAYCYRGKVIHTVTYHVGGRLIRLQPDGTITYISGALQPWLEANGYALRCGERITYETLRNLTITLNRSLLSALRHASDETSQLLMIGSTAQEVTREHSLTFSKIMISGGIGQWFYTMDSNPTALEEVTVFGDVGPLLASSLRVVCEEQGLEIIPPLQTVRATVLGAGMQSTEISGSTVHFEPGLLPLRNVPIVQFAIPVTDSPSFASQYTTLLHHTFRQAAALYLESDASASRTDSRIRVIGFALQVRKLKYLSYDQLEYVATQLIAAFRLYFPHVETLVLVCEQDIAKALGQRLHLLCLGQPQLICIDQIRVEHGDYIDLGTPVNGTTIPVIIKTLAF